MAEGSQVSADPTTQVWYSGAVGAESFVAHLPNGTTQTVPSPGGLVDFAARGGQLIVLTDDHKLHQYDGETRVLQARGNYYGPLGMERLQLFYFVQMAV